MSPLGSPIRLDHRVALLLTIVLGLAAQGRAALGAEWMQLAPEDPTRPPARAGHTVILDEPGRRLIAWGDRIAADEIFVLPLDGPADWTRIPTAGTPPPARVLHTAVFDPVHRRMIVFGGGTYETQIDYRNDVWALSLDDPPTWTELHPLGNPPDPCQQHAAIYDPRRERMLVFGGISSAGPSAVIEDSVWELSLGDPLQWRKVLTTGTPPRERKNPSMVYDASLDRAVIFGGYNYNDYSTPYFNDVWTLSFTGASVWRLLTPTGAAPSPRYQHAAVMDAARNRMIVFGGRGLNLIPCADTWALAFALGANASWTKLSTDSVPARSSHAAFLDPVGDRLVSDGGTRRDYRMTETLALPLGGPHVWQQIGPVSPSAFPPRCYLASLTVDPVKDELLVEGGNGYFTYGPFPNALWAWPLAPAAGAWTRTPLPGPPNEYSPGRAAFDPVGRRQFRFFTATSSGVSVMSLDSPGAWTTFDVQGPGPPPREGFSTAFDPLRNRMLLLGGYVVPMRGHALTIFRDVWALDLAGPPTWRLVRPDGSGPQIFEDGGFCDVAGDRLVAMGWAPALGVWSFPLDGGSDWSLLRAAPPRQPLGPVAFDPDGQQLILVDTWTARAWSAGLDSAGAWLQLEPTGVAPAPRKHAMLAFDRAHRRLLMFGGLGISGGGVGYRPLDDLWALKLDAPTATPLAVVSADAAPDLVRLRWSSGLATGAAVTLERCWDGELWEPRATLFADGSGMLAWADRDVVPGVRYGYRILARDARAPGGEVWVTVPLAPSLALLGARPNPASEALWVGFSLPGGAPARLELFDLAGRMLDSREVGGLGPGEHALRLGPERLAPGVYLARLVQNGRRLTARIAIAR